MRLIDADALYDKAETWYKNAPTPFRQIYRSFVDAIADAHTIAPPPNDPLTLEELREMDGDPVWVECLTNQKCSCWGYHDEDGVNGYCAYFDDDEYRKVWLAYRRKPEEGET